jgi:hypothetical protein
MRALLFVVPTLFLAVPAWADEPAPTPAAPAGAERKAEPALPVAGVELPLPATALAPGRAGDEVVAATDDGAVVRVVVGKGVVARTKAAGARIEALAAAPSGDLVASGTLTELQVFDFTASAALWRAPRPVAFAFDPTGKRLITVTEQGEVVERDASTGKELARRQVAEKRSVVRASLHPAAGVAVLGVADG